MVIPLRQLDIGTLESTFSSADECLKFLADKKWEQPNECRKCGNINYCKGKTPYSRRCTRCKSEESATANTIFHRCHIPITEAFRIVFMVCHEPGISTYELSRMLDLRQMTCWKLKNRLKECMDRHGELDILYHEPSHSATKPRGKKKID